MRGTIELVKGFAKVPPMAALKRFERYGLGSLKRQRIGNPIVEDKASMQIAEAWEKYRNKVGRNYELAVDLIRGIDYSSGDVSSFCTTLNDICTEKLAIEKAAMDICSFISALVNMGNDPDYILPLDPFDRVFLFCGLGYKNTKNVTIHGNIGYDFCMRMERGVVRLKSSCWDGIGEHMSGGTLIIDGSSTGVDGIGQFNNGGEIILNGDLDGPVGSDMKRGKITIQGDIKGEIIDNIFETFLLSGSPDPSDLVLIGEGMSGGEIHLNGDFDERMLDESTVKGGKIFHKGKVIVDK